MPMLILHDRGQPHASTTVPGTTCVTYKVFSSDSKARSYATAHVNDDNTVTYSSGSKRAPENHELTDEDFAKVPSIEEW